MYPCQPFYQEQPLPGALQLIYQRLLQHFGPQHWWPAETPLETIVGAILTQAVSWNNVVKAIANLKGEDLLQPEALREVAPEKLAQLIKPSGYYNLKARKIKAFIDFLYREYKGELGKMWQEPLTKLRSALLKVYGIGPETADSILLYAGNYPIFVIDAYTRRIFSRLGLAESDVSYAKLQRLFLDNLEADPAVFNEYHALLVVLGKNYCKKRKALCGNCPLSKI